MTSIANTTARRLTLEEFSKKIGKVCGFFRSNAYVGDRHTVVPDSPAGSVPDVTAPTTSGA
jgi:hypothetical protein